MIDAPQEDGTSGETRVEARFSIIVPVHNEAAFLAQGLEGVYQASTALGPEVEVLLVENGSSDGTAAAARELQQRYPALRLLELREADYGAALRAGLLAARGAWRISFDIDYVSRDFLQALLRLEDQVDLLIASKRAHGSRDRRPRLRRWGTRTFGTLLRVLFRSRCSDTHGIKAARREIVEEIAPRVRSTRDLFDTELVLRAERAGYRVAEVPIRVEELRPARTSFLKRVPRTMIGLLRMRYRFWREGLRAP